jgi:hypothetical protein
MRCRFGSATPNGGRYRLRLTVEPFFRPTRRPHARRNGRLPPACRGGTWAASPLLGHRPFVRRSRSSQLSADGLTTAGKERPSRGIRDSQHRIASRSVRPYVRSPFALRIKPRAVPPAFAVMSSRPPGTEHLFAPVEIVFDEKDPFNAVMARSGYGVALALSSQLLRGTGGRPSPWQGDSS